MQKLVKQGKDSASVYEGQGRADLAEEEMAQVRVIEAYLPKQLSPEELEAKRQEIPNFQYDASTRTSMRNSLTLPKEEVDKLIAEGKQYVVRFKIEPNEDVHVHDLIRGEVVINSSILDDKVLYKSADELLLTTWLTSLTTT